MASLCLIALLVVASVDSKSSSASDTVLDSSDGGERHLRQNRHLLSAGGPSKPPVILVPGLGSSREYGRWCYKIRENMCDRMSGHTCAGAFGVGDCSTECALPNLGGLTPAGATWVQLWASTDAVLLHASASICWREKLEQTFDGKDFLEKHADLQVTAWREPNWDSKGQFVMTDDFGGLQGVDHILDVPILGAPTAAYIYHTLIDKLKKERGYVEKESIFGAPYLSPKITADKYSNEYFELLKALIEHAYCLAGGRRAVLVGHSLGCPLVQRFLTIFLPKVLGGATQAQTWKDKFIGVFVSIAGPYGGAAKSVVTYITGDAVGMGNQVTGLLDQLTQDRWFQPAEKLLAGCLWMTPRADVFQGLSLVTVDGKVYTSSHADMLSFIKGAAKEAMVADALDKTVFVPRLYDEGLKHPGVQVVAIISAFRTKTTALQILYKADPAAASGAAFVDKFIPTVTPESTFYAQLFDAAGKGLAGGSATKLQLDLAAGTKRTDMVGDGTVPFLSLAVPKLWVTDPLAVKYPVTVVNLGDSSPASPAEADAGKYEHKEILESVKMLLEVTKAVDLLAVKEATGTLAQAGCELSRPKRGAL